MKISERRKSKSDHIMCYSNDKKHGLTLVDILHFIGVIKSCLILVVKVNGQGHFLTIFCLWSHLFLTFAWHHQSPVAILIQPRDLRAMVRGWTPGMTPRYNSLPRQKKFRHDNTIRLVPFSKIMWSIFHSIFHI